jgi:hypothetical protein
MSLRMIYAYITNLMNIPYYFRVSQDGSFYKRLRACELNIDR